MGNMNWQNRRDFLRYSITTAAVLSGVGSKASGSVLAGDGEKLTILYTNDQHSRIEPFPDNDVKYSGEGGFAKRASLIERIRKEEEHVLLLDAGDIFQGTPYFNYFKGKVEYKLMSMMKYDATTFGNHDFDLGCGNIVEQMPYAEFDFINCNYSFKGTALEGSKRVAPFKIYKRGNLKIGVLGIGIDLENLVDKKYAKDVLYSDPTESVNKYAKILKYDFKCDYVICLSHLGYKYDSKKISDVSLAPLTENVDLFIGGHTHTFLDEPVTLSNKAGMPVTITQVGWAGIWLGKIELFFSSDKKNIFHRSKNERVS